MNLHRFYLTGAVVLALELAVTAWGLARVGPDALVPVHWNVSGAPDGHAPAWVGFLIGPLVTALVVVLAGVVPRVEPRRENLRRSSSAYRTAMFAVVLFMGLIHVVAVLAGTGVDVPVGAVVGAGVGVLLAVIGNVLSTVRSTFLFGVRTPWTLTSERSWARTHRVVGRLFVLTGILMVAVSLTGQLPLVMGVMLLMLVVTLVGGTWYSYRQWQADPDRRPIGGRA